MKERSYRRFRFGIQDRIVLWLLLLGIIPVVATSLLGHWVLSTATTRATGNQLQAVCERLAGNVDAELHRLVRGLGNLNPTVIRGAIATAPRNQDSLATARYLNRLTADWPRDSSSRTSRFLSGSLADELRRLRRLNPVLFDRLLVTDARGVVLGATHATNRPHHADDAWWRTTYNDGRGATYLSKLYHSDGSYLFNVAVPLYDSTGTNVVAVIRVLANLSDMAESIEDVEIGNTGFATLTSTYGDVLISPLPATGLASIVTTDRRRRITTSYPIWYRGRGLIANTNAVVAVAPVAATTSRSRANLGGSSWVVTVEQDVAEILGPTHQFGRIAVFLILLMAALVMVIGLFQSERIVRPLRDLRDGARLIGTGRLDHRLDLHTGDEIENVATEFNSMAGRLDESYRGLEAKIRAATAELAREKNSLQAIVAALGEGLMVVDTDHHIVLWNHTAETMTGFEAKEVIGQRCDDILRTGSDNRPALCRDGCPACAAVDEGRPVASPDMSSWVLRRDGTKLYVTFTASPLTDDSGRATGCVVVLRDITREKEIDQLKSNMISIVSHELRAPLTPIIGFAEMLQNADLPEEKRRQFTEIIVREGRRLEQLINDFLTLSRIEAGRFELHLEETDLHTLVEEIFTVECTQHTGHTFENDIPSGFPPVRADRERIRRALYNLISNAIKYSPDGGTVSASIDDRGDEVDIAVSDQGVGIRSEDIDKLFHRFQRVNRTATPGVTGTGLGLSITASIVREHGGDVWVDSEYGKGSTFTIRLPKTGPPATDG